MPDVFWDSEVVVTYVRDPDAWFGYYNGLALYDGSGGYDDPSGWGAYNDTRIGEDYGGNLTPDQGNEVKLADGAKVPDGTVYWAPEGVDAAYLLKALEHIRSIYNNNITNMAAVYAELLSMYTDPTNPYFVDFKDFGTENGPDCARNSYSGTMSYWSSAANDWIDGASVFEPFGNYFFGFICTYAGLSADETWAVAAAMQTNGFGSDDPQDVPHVSQGIGDAQEYLSEIALHQSNPSITVDPAFEIVTDPE